MQRYALETVVPPTTEPVSVDEIKSHLRITDFDADNGLIGAYLASAREYVESQSELTLQATTFRMRLDRFPYEEHPIQYAYGLIKFPRFPVQSVTSIKYYDNNANEITLAEAAYQLDIYSRVPRIHPAPYSVWPVTQIGRLNAVTIEFVAGFTTVPDRIKQAIRLLVGHMYEHREATTEASLSAVPVGLQTFIRSAAVGSYM